MDIEKMAEIPCDKCGFKLGLREFDLPEIAAGVWGTINCPKCQNYMNPSIQTFYDL